MLEKGARFVLDSDPSPGDAKRVHLPHREILSALEPGHHLILDDGKLRLVVEKASPEQAVTKVLVGGRLSSRKGVSLPDTTIAVSAMTEKDRADAEVAAEVGVDTFFSGLGGDNVFCALMTAAPAADALRTFGTNHRFFSALSDLSRRHETTVWHALRSTLRKASTSRVGGLAYSWPIGASGAP